MLKFVRLYGPTLRKTFLVNRILENDKIPGAVIVEFAVARTQILSK
jgi:hypothetical protein